MNKNSKIYKDFIQILNEELVPAMGCTEPIALAYAGAKAREILGEMPDKVLVQASGSIIKNVKSVIVPNTNHLKGIPAATVAGIVAGRAEKELEVIAEVTEEEMAAMKVFLETRVVEVEHIDLGCTFDIIVTVYKGASYTKVRIVNYHTNIVLI
ncbi:MAG: serine dehydratase subunit alpha family protein, partial [Eubacteriales bacterium]